MRAGPPGPARASRIPARRFFPFPGRHDGPRSKEDRVPGPTGRGECHNRPMRFFNTEGPVRPDDHYAIPPWTGWTSMNFWP